MNLSHIFIFFRHCHLQKIQKNISKMIFEKFFLQILLFLFEETFCIKKFKFSSRVKKLKK